LLFLELLSFPLKERFKYDFEFIEPIVHERDIRFLKDKSNSLLDFEIMLCDRLKLSEHEFKKQGEFIYLRRIFSKLISELEDTRVYKNLLKSL